MIGKIAGKDSRQVQTFAFGGRQETDIPRKHLRHLLQLAGIFGRIGFKEKRNDAEIHLARFAECLHRVQDSVVGSISAENIHRHAACRMHPQAVVRPDTGNHIRQDRIFQGKDIEVGIRPDSFGVGCPGTAQPGGKPLRIFRRMAIHLPDPHPFPVHFERQARRQVAGA